MMSPWVALPEKRPSILPGTSFTARPKVGTTITATRMAMAPPAISKKSRKPPMGSKARHQHSRAPSRVCSRTMEDRAREMLQ